MASKNIDSLEPRLFWKYFKQISEIPRPSYQTEAISEYLSSQITKLNLTPNVDSNGNIYFQVPATPGNENQPSVLLQGHSDMVADKEESSTHDFDTDPLDIYVDGDFVKAKGTTLGADDGVALAMILALLNDSEFKHGPLEVIFSANEEVSPMGISAFDTSLIKSKYMLNIDSESSDLVTVGCAGCIIFDGVIKTKKIKSKKTNKSYCIEIKNGLGGHSGIEIHKKIINAVKASAELLNELEKTFEFSIVKINGGKFPNAIPHSCTTVIQCEKDELEEIVACASKKFAKIKSSYPDEINISLSIHEVENDSYSLSKKDSSIAIAALCDIFNGVYTNNKEFNIPNTSCNLGIIRTNENDITMTHMVRSLESNEMDKLYSLMSKTYKLASADIVYRDKMMPWTPSKTNSLANLYLDIFNKNSEKKAALYVVPAGLEVAYISKSIPDLVAISVGPDMFGAHTYNEKLSIPETGRVYQVVKKLLEEIR